jgi:hypothetical protein
LYKQNASLSCKRSVKTIHLNRKGYHPLIDKIHYPFTYTFVMTHPNPASMNKPISLFLAITLVATSVIGRAQVSDPYRFFKGDTLQGFDLNTGLLEVQKAHVTGVEIRSCIRKKELQFVEQKYHLTQRERKSVWPNPAPASGSTNLGFETGDFTGWTGFTGYNNNSNLPLTGQTQGLVNLGLNSAETSCAAHTIVSQGTDPYGGFPVINPGVGAFVCRLGGENYNVAGIGIGPCNTGDPNTFASSGECLQQTFIVTQANALFTYQDAIVFSSAPHSPSQMPYFKAEVLDQNGNVIPCFQYIAISDSAGPPAGFILSSIQNSNLENVFYRPWTSTSFNLTPFRGQQITIRFTAAGCGLGGHFGYAYIDAYSTPVEVTVASSSTSCQGTLTAPPVSSGGSYQWKTMPSGNAGIVGSTTGQSVSLNASGTYEVKVTSGPGCFYVIDTTISFATSAALSMLTKNTNCPGTSDGQLTASITGGKAPFTYVWTPAAGSGQGTAKLTGLSAGTYSLTVTDASGCSSSTAALVSSPPPISASLSSTTATCGSPNGTVTVAASGGTGSISYSWNTTPAQLTATASGLGSGIYSVTLSDSLGCSQSFSASISNSGGPALTPIVTDVSCAGSSDGAATVNAGGGTGAYTYSWSTVPSKTTASITNVQAGTYTVSVKDGGSCFSFLTVTISQPNSIVSFFAKTNPTCFNFNNGKATASASGGTGTYTYSWSTSPSQSTSSVSNLSPGTYSLTIKDSMGCISQTSFSISQPIVLGLTYTATIPTCFGMANGSASAVATGGTGAYTYSWNTTPPQTTATIINLPSANYIVTVIDSAGCVTNDSFFMLQPNQITLTNTFTQQVQCNGGTNGSVTAIAGSGSPPYFYLWNTIPQQTGPSATNLAAGTYLVTVTDSKSCADSINISVTQPIALGAVKTTTDPLCSGCLNGTAVIHVFGGIPGYSYSWSPAPGTGQGTDSISGLGAGQYTVTVTDSNQCTLTTTFQINVFTGLTDYLSVDVFKLYPNPASESITVELTKSLSPSPGVFTVCNMLGQQMLVLKQTAGAGSKQYLDVSTLSDGIYFIALDTPNGKSIRKFMIQK